MLKKQKIPKYACDCTNCFRTLIVVTVASTANQNEELRRELHAEKEESRRLSDRLQRMQDGEAVMREALDKMQQEVTTLRLTAAHA